MNQPVPPRASAAIPAPFRPASLSSLRFRILLALAALVLASLAPSAFLLRALDQQGLGHEAQALAGQLQLAHEALQRQSLNYRENAARDWDSYYRDLRVYFHDFNQRTGEIDALVAGLSPGADDGRLHAYLDGPARHAAERLEAAWRQFRRRLTDELRDPDDPDGPRIEAGAGFVLSGGGELEAALSDFAAETARLVAARARQALAWVWTAAAVSAVLAAAVVSWFAWRVARPLDRAAQAFEHVARGHFGHQVPVQGRDEIAVMAHAFNRLSSRVDALVRLTQRIQQSGDLAATLAFVGEEFRRLLPADWIGVLLQAPEGGHLRLEASSEDTPGGTAARARFPLEAGLAGRCLEQAAPLAVADTAALAATDAEWAALFTGRGLRSVLLSPLRTSAGTPGLLVLGARQSDAYAPEHAELMGNIAALVSHGLEKTLVVEHLVVSAVEGLAKLAESRDPETGDHLVRMSLYSAIVAEQLGREGPYRDRVDGRFVRDVFRFAPMHDIGKVGVPDRILLKAGALDDEERRAMQRHPVIGGEVLRQCEAQMNRLGRQVFRAGIDIAEGHHEKYDGSGYPHGVKGEEIPLAARIIAAADIFDALTSRRPYKEAWPVEQALAWMREQAGRHLDPAVVAALEQALPQVLEVYGRLRHV